MKHTNKIFSVILVLAMLVGTLTMLTIGGATTASAEAASGSVNPTFDEVDEFRIVTPNYKSNWAGSEIKSVSWNASTTGTWVASDGSTNGAMQWTGNANLKWDDGTTGAKLSDDGVLSFPAAGNASLKYMPYQSHNITAGPVRITFEIYIDATTPIVTYEGNRTWLFYIRDGKLYHTSNKWWNADANKVLVAEMTEGWNTIEMIFMPTLADGSISTDSSDTLAENMLYMRAYASGTEDANPAYTPNDLKAKFFSKTLAPNKKEAEDMEHFATGIGGGATFKLADKDSTDGTTDVLQIRSATAANLLPYVEKPVAVFLGYEQLNQTVDIGTTITIPEVAGVKAWMLNDTYFYAGETYVVSADTTFAPVTDMMYFSDCRYDTSILWKDANKMNSTNSYNVHAGEGWTGALWLYKNDEKGSFTYTDADKSIEISSFGNKKNYFDWFWCHYVNENKTQTAYSGYTNFMFSFDVSYTEGDFDGVRIMSNWGNMTLASVSAEGVLSVGSVATSQTMKDGWNNIKLFAIQNEAKTSYTFYIALNVDTDNAEFSPTQMTALPTCTWQTSSITSHRMYIYPMDTNATSEAPAYLKARNFASAGLSLSAANFIAVEDTRKAEVIPTGTEYTTPTQADVDRWLTSDANGIYNVATPGEAVTVNSDMVLTGVKTNSAKFAGATMSLGTTMTLNMKAALSTFGGAVPTSGYVIAAGTDIKADATATSDGYLTAAISGIYACDMGKARDYYIVSVIDGVTYISEAAKSYSPAQYAAALYTAPGYDENAKAVALAMLSYGAVSEGTAYGTSEIKAIATTAGIAGSALYTALPENYGNGYVAITDKAAVAEAINALNSVGMTGAELSESVNMVFEITDATVTQLTVTAAGFEKTYEAVTENGKTTITITDLQPRNIRNLLTLTFKTASGEVKATANFSIGNFLENVITNNTNGQGSLAAVTVLYMMSVRDYAIATGIAE